MKGRTLVVGLLAALVALAAVLFLLAYASGSPAAGAAGAAASPGPATGSTAPASGGELAIDHDGGPIARTIADRRVRDELRRRILEGWAQGSGERAEAARTGRIPSMPLDADGGIDRRYIQGVFREDMMPLASKCYEELLTRKPDAGGRIDLHFKVVGDDTLGGVVEEAEIDGGLASGDERLGTCIRESLLTLSFRPPPSDGWVSVVYPITFSPDDEPDE